MRIGTLFGDSVTGAIAKVTADMKLQLSKRSVSAKLVCFGDLAYKGPSPAECIKEVHNLGIPVVHGNTDHYLLTLTEYEFDCPMAGKVKITPE